MADLVATMTALRDAKGWPLADGLIRAAARNDGGSIDSLDRAFRRTGVEQPREVLGRLVELRAAAEQMLARSPAGPPSTPVTGPSSSPSPSRSGSAPSSASPSASSSASPSTVAGGSDPASGPDWQGPPSWYRSLPDREETPAPAAPRLSVVPDPAPQPAPGPPQWYRDLQAKDAADAAAATAAATPAAATPAPPAPPARLPLDPDATDPFGRQPARHRADGPVGAQPSPVQPSPAQPSGAWPSPGQPSTGRAPAPWAGSPHRTTGSDRPAGSPAGPPEPAPTRPVTADELPDPATLSSEWDAFVESDATLKAVVDSTGRTILHWDAHVPPSGSTAVYLVCGSVDEVPESPSAGDRLAVTLERQVIVPDARHRFFAVFAYPVRSAADLPDATAVRHAIGRVLTEVADLVVEPAEHGVLLSWTAPAGVDRVRVMRSLPGRSLPRGPDTSRQLTFRGHTFRDGDVEPGATYTYRVYTESLVLGAPDGSIESSPGVERTVTVPGRPDPVAELRGQIMHRDGRVGVSASWRPPTRGEVTLYVAPGGPNADTVVGRTLSADQWALQVDLLGERIREPIVAVEDRDTVPWIPLDTHVDGGRHSQWTISAVTEFSGTRIIGAQDVMLHVGDIDEMEIEERVDWQLVRSTWPTGATFLGVWFVPPGGRSHGAPMRLVNRDEFDRFGGVGVALGPDPVDVLLQGATRYGGDYIRGGQFRKAYPGRWTVRWDLVTVNRFGSTRSLHLFVDRPHWPNLSFMLLADTTGFPLGTDGPTIQRVCQGELPAVALVPGQWIPAVPEVRVPKGAHLRLLVWTGSGTPPIVIDPVGPPVAPPAPAPAPPLHCPRCLREADLQVQQFRCQGSCDPRIDHGLTQLLHPGSSDPADEVVAKPVFAVPRSRRQERRETVLDPPATTAHCSNCGVPSRQEVCPHCHSDLPPNWWAHEVLGVVMVGARQSGKTTYLSGLVGHLETTLLPATGGHLRPIDPESEVKLTAHRNMIRAGELFPSTLSVAQNEQLLRPMVASIGRAPDGRNRAISLFDVAGEDMSRTETVRPYAPALAHSDLIVILIDPLQLPGVREWLHGVVPLPEQGAPPLTVVGNVVNEIRLLRGIPTGRLPNRAAVVFAKFDGIQAVAKEPQSPLSRLIGPGNALWRDPYVNQPGLYSEPDGRRVHDEVRALLLAMNERALVDEVEQSFAEFRYFALSALGHGPKGRQLTDAGASPQRVGDPIRWLLWSRGWGT